MRTARKRGRPLKFGRPARTVAVTLPTDVIANLRARNADVARAIVALVQTSPIRDRLLPPAAKIVDIEPTGRRQGLIVVDPAVLPALPGCRLIQIAPHRAFIAFEPGAGLPHLELAVTDRLAEPGLTAEERAALETLQRALRRWRRSKRVTAQERSIVVLEGEA